MSRSGSMAWRAPDNDVPGGAAITRAMRDVVRAARYAVNWTASARTIAASGSGTATAWNRGRAGRRRVAPDCSRSAAADIEPPRYSPRRQVRRSTGPNPCRVLPMKSPLWVDSVEKLCGCVAVI